MQDFIQAIRAAIALIGSLDPEIVGIVAISLSVSLSASLIAMVIGAPLGGMLAVSRFRGRQAIIVLANALLGLPPVVVGLAVYLLLLVLPIYYSLRSNAFETAKWNDAVFQPSPGVSTFPYAKVEDDDD